MYLIMSRMAERETAEFVCASRPETLSMIFYVYCGSEGM
jgi:hypothetical protein